VQNYLGIIVLLNLGL